MSDEASREQPRSKGKGDLVGPAVIKDILTRNEIGEKKYGEMLRSHNGRDPLVDLYQELLDAVQYCKQELMERSVRSSSVGGLPTLELVAIANLCADAILGESESTVNAHAAAQSIKDHVPKASPTTTLRIMVQAIVEINSRTKRPE